jgi:hypothetical protein
MENSPRSFQFCVAVVLLVVGVQTSLCQGQQSNTSTGNPVQSAGANSGTYYIEDEILAYKSLQLNSQSIAGSLQTELSGTGVVVLPSASTVLPAFQLWRSNMLISKAYIQQADNILISANKVDANGKQVRDKDGNPVPAGPCPANPIRSLTASTSFGGVATGITTGVGVIQSILSLFTSNQSAAGFQGTVQDQALMIAVSQEIRTNNNGKNLTVLVPDVFTPWNIDLGEDSPDSKYFIGRLSQLVTRLSNLQDYYVCNQLVAAAGQQLVQGEQTLDADLTKLATTTVKDADYTTIRSDIGNQESQIQILRPKIGLDVTKPPVTIWKDSLDTAIQALPSSAPTSGPPLPLGTLKTILINEAAVIATENPKLVMATSASSKAQSILTGIGGYLSALTGGAVTFSTPTTPSAQAATPSTTSTTPNSSTTPSSPGGAQTQGGSPQGASPQGGPTQATASQSSSAPPIVTILQADGLARKMKVEPDSNANWGFNGWKVLWVKALESGSTTDMRSNIWGEKVRFAGGAVSGYALFQIDGTLVCSGNAAAYGGEIEPKQFLDPKNLKVQTMIVLNSDCKQKAPDPAK